MITNCIQRKPKIDVKPILGTKSQYDRIYLATKLFVFSAILVENKSASKNVPI